MVFACCSPFHLLQSDLPSLYLLDFRRRAYLKQLVIAGLGLQLAAVFDGLLEVGGLWDGHVESCFFGGFGGLGGSVDGSASLVLRGG